MLLLTGVPSAGAAKPLIDISSWQLFKLLVANWSSEILTFIFAAFILYGLFSLLVRSRHRVITQTTQASKAKAAGADQ